MTTSEYKIYPELVSFYTNYNRYTKKQYNGLIVDKDININGIFKPLMKKQYRKQIHVINLYNICLKKYILNYY